MSIWGAPLGAIAGYGPWIPEKEAICWKPSAAIVIPPDPNKPQDVKFLPRHPAPQEDCKCGYWALKNDANGRRRLLDMLKMSHCIGTTLLWGRMIEGEEGWRAEYARPNRVYLSPEQKRFAPMIQDSYRGVDVMLDQFGGIGKLELLPGAMWNAEMSMDEYRGRPPRRRNEGPMFIPDWG